MAHPNIEGLAKYWQSRRTGGFAPARGDIHPGDFAPLASAAFIWGREMRGVYPFRLVGGRIGALFGRDLRGENGLSLWRPKDALALSGALEVILRRPAPLLAGTTLLTRDGDRMDAEMFFAPLCGPSGQPDRFLGLLQVTIRSSSPAMRFELIDLAGSGEAPLLRLAAAYGRTV